MAQEDIQEILKLGIYGTPQTKPAERKLFLSSIRERVWLALTRSQVNRGMPYREVEEVLRSRNDVHLFLNGSLPYESISPYIKLASKNGAQFTIVSNQASETPVGLVASASKAVDVSSVFIEDERYERDIGEKK
ncbi:YueI family protein [Bacillus marinisedimentorum]|uniref:YueI family protein n=1 Tax=Bacillus marinisedimentorum TaxID=1821260 RepID=UPI000872B07C|nr:YueI family protein [Bacillus marinisedimentorum]